MGLANEEFPCEGVPQISFDPKIMEIIPILGAAGQGSQVSSWIKSFHLEKNNKCHFHPCVNLFVAGFCRVPGVGAAGGGAGDAPRKLCQSPSLPVVCLGVR